MRERERESEKEEKTRKDEKVTKEGTKREKSELRVTEERDKEWKRQRAKESEIERA